PNGAGIDESAVPVPVEVHTTSALDCATVNNGTCGVTEVDAVLMHRCDGAGVRKCRCCTIDCNRASVGSGNRARIRKGTHGAADPHAVSLLPGDGPRVGE